MHDHFITVTLVRTKDPNLRYPNEEDIEKIETNFIARYVVSVSAPPAKLALPLENARLTLPMGEFALMEGVDEVKKRVNAALNVE